VFLPLGDSPNPARPQWVTRTLVAANVAVFLLVSLPLERPITREDLRDPDVLGTVAEMQRYMEAPPRSHYDLFIWNHGYRPGAPSLLTLLTCMFLHAGWAHLLGNMLYLWIYGDNVEARLGPLPFLGAYLATGAVATLSFASLKSGSMVPMVGASGAISGVLGFYLVWFPRNQIRVLVFFFYLLHIVHVPALFVLGFYLVFDNILPYLVERSSAAGGGVAYGAHLGGFFAGVLFAFVLDLLRGRTPAPRPGPHPPQAVHWGRGGLSTMQPAPVSDWRGAFAAALREGRMRAAADSFAHLAADETAAPPDPLEVFRLGQWLYSQDQSSDAAAVFRYYIRHFPRGGDLDRAHLGLGLLLSRRLGQRMAAREHLLAAIDLARKSPTVAETARAELALIDLR